LPSARTHVPTADSRTAARWRGRAPHSFLARLTVVAALVSFTNTAHATGIPEIEALVAAGTPRLALTVIDADQPPPGRDPSDWMAWENARLTLLRDLNEWAALEARVSTHPTNLPREFTDRSRTLQAEATLARGDGSTARAHLRSLIWQGGNDAAEALPHWRDLMIRSYLADGLTEDAHLAMLRYRQDHGSDDPALRELGVRILLRAGRPDAALAALGDADDPTSDALRLLALLRSGQLPASEIRRDAEKQARAAEHGKETRAATHYWAVAAEAAAAAEETGARVAALEAGLPAQEQPPGESLFALTPEDLWAAYRTHGEVLGNRAQLLVGQDAAWFELATGRATKDPLAARALFATLARIARDSALRQASHVAFAASLADAPRGVLLLKRLYLDSDPGLPVDNVPSQLRQRLADEALAAGDVATGARLLTGLDGPPPGADAFTWRLQRGVVLVRVGDPKRGGAELVQLVTTQPERSAAELAVLLPAISTLQEAGGHAPAAEVLALLLHAPQDDSGQHRALLLALADSQRALDHPAIAARYYLRGAFLPGTKPGDTRGREARRLASVALVDAGYTTDARNLLQELIVEAKGTERKALKQELQRLQGRD